MRGRALTDDRQVTFAGSPDPLVDLGGQVLDEEEALPALDCMLYWNPPLLALPSCRSFLVFSAGAAPRAPPTTRYRPAPADTQTLAQHLRFKCRGRGSWQATSVHPSKAPSVSPPRAAHVNPDFPVVPRDVPRAVPTPARSSSPRCCGGSCRRRQLRPCHLPTQQVVSGRSPRNAGRDPERVTVDVGDVMVT